MRSIQAIALACMFAAPLAFAQAPASAAKTQLATKMYDIAGAGAVFQAMESNVIGRFMGELGQSLGDKASCAALQPEVQSFKTKMDGMFNTMNDAQFRQEAAKVYADTFTEDEMKQIIAFMQSPAGVKMTRVQGDLGQRIGKLAATHAQPHEADIRAAMATFADKVQNIAKTCPVAPAPAAQPPSK